MFLFYDSLRPPGSTETPGNRKFDSDVRVSYFQPSQNYAFLYQIPTTILTGPLPARQEWRKLVFPDLLLFYNLLTEQPNNTTSQREVMIDKSIISTFKWKANMGDI